MKKYILTLAFFTGMLAANAQLPEDVLRYSYYPVNGSARNMAIGGAMGSLGGDISALFVNPAGLGLFKTREFSITPGLHFNNNKLNFRGTENTKDNSAFNLGASGLIFGFNSPGSKWTSQAISIGINTTANFNNNISYKGSNDFSSMSELFAEQFASSGQDFFDAINNPRFAFGTGPALYTYLVDTFTNQNTGAIEVKGLPQFLLEQGVALNQETSIRTTGGSTELSLGYAANMDDKIFVGGAIGVPILSYERISTYRESDPTNNKTNNFNFFELKDRLKTSGIGVNAKLGVIIKPAEQFRVGLAIHTPTFLSLTDEQNAEMTTDTEGFAGKLWQTSDSLTGTGGPGETQYLAITPWKAMISGSYVFREVNDTRRQRAFITADIEYVGYSSGTFKAGGDNVEFSDREYYKDLKEVIKDEYKRTFNFRLGGELKLNTVMFRLGGAYYGNPYKDDNLKAGFFQATGGLGYRNYGMFIDLSYAHSFLKDVHFPYRLVDKANTFATQNGSRGNVVLTVGFKI